MEEMPPFPYAVNFPSNGSIGELRVERPADDTLLYVPDKEKGGYKPLERKPEPRRPLGFR